MSTEKPVKLRVVLDTNVYFSAFTHKGLPFWIWQQAVLRRFVLLVSPALLRELGDVLRHKASWQEAEVIAQLKLLVKVSVMTSPAITIQAIMEDDDDNRVLECAVAGEADLVVSSDHHLRQHSGPSKASALSTPLISVAPLDSINHYPMLSKPINEALLDADDDNRRLRRRANDLPPALGQMVAHLCGAVGDLIEAEKVPLRRRRSKLYTEAEEIVSLRSEAARHLEVVIRELYAGSGQEENPTDS